MLLLLIRKYILPEQYLLGKLDKNIFCLKIIYPETLTFGNVNVHKHYFVIVFI